MLSNMTQEEKELLFKDLSARLPYGVKAYVRNWSKLDRKYYEGVYIVDTICPLLNNVLVTSDKFSVEVIVGYDDYEIKPYLFPLSSMTKEQNLEYLRTCKGGNAGIPTLASFDWLNKNHFDYRGLIEKSLALDAIGKNIYEL